MKTNQRWIPGVIFLFLVVLLAGTLPRSGPPKHIGTSFLGFNGSIAHFAISNPPPSTVMLHSVRSLPALHSPGGVGTLTGFFKSVAREPWGLSMQISLDSTNTPMEVVFQFQLRSVGPRRIWEVAQERFWRLLGQDREIFNGALVWVTNQTQPGISYDPALQIPMPRSE